LSFWKSLGDTVKSLGGAIAAPYGAVYDLASAPFDDKADNFGTYAAKVASRTSQLGDPFFNKHTWSGYAFGKTMDALDTAYREGVSEPISTGITMAGHVERDPLHNAGDLFDSTKWADAYKTAQTRSIGQSAFLLGLNQLNGAAGHGRP
jgi:hypothetical protein